MKFGHGTASNTRSTAGSKSKAIVEDTAEGYAGHYEVPDLGYVIDFHSTNAALSANGVEPGREDGNTAPRPFHLTDIEVKEGLLTAHTVYDDDGSIQPLKGFSFILPNLIARPTQERLPMDSELQMIR